MVFFTRPKAPNVRQTIINAFESGRVLTNGSANELTKSSEGGRAIRQLRQEGFPISERWRPNRIRKGQIKEYFYTEETRRRIREERALEAKGIMN